ncbi:hypothetical protein IAU59_001417 [Kwoniella sp. CBS 9459]
MSTSLRRTGSVNNKRASAAPSFSSSSKRGSAYLGASGPMNVELGGVSPEPLLDEANALRKIIEGLNRTNSALRNKIGDLETNIEHGTGPEVERLNKELSTLEDLFARTQRDNETKHAEGERQKTYVKELENLLSTTLGPDWQASHNVYPPASTTTIVTPSTPLPGPRQAPTSSLRHSVSFSKRNTGKQVHRRASSAMDLKMMCLQAVREDESGLDDTPTGALRRLNGSIHGGGKGKELGPSNTASQSLVAQRVLMPDSSSDAMTSSQENQKATTQPVKSSTSPTIESPPSAPLGATVQESSALPGVDMDRLNDVLRMLSSSNISDSHSHLRSHAKQSSGSDASSTASTTADRDAQLKMIKCMLMDQERRLNEREARLTAIIQTAREKERRYELPL